MQVERVLNLLEVMHLVFHVGTHRLPVADGQGQAGAGEFQTEVLAAGGMMKAHSHSVLALNTVLSRALGLNYPGGVSFPGHENRFAVPLGHYADFAALAVETGGYYFMAAVIALEPDE
ncbi:hypothetical protein D3C78_1703330 [compost metagenome]